MRTMFDSTAAADIPAGSELVAGYLDGSSAWTAADWARFPGRRLVRICIFNDRFDGDMLDVEPGNNDAQGSVPWVRGMWDRGRTPTVYCFSEVGPEGYRIQDVRAACDAAGVKRPLIVITKFDGIAALPPDPEVIGKQYANADLTGGHYDASVVVDHWPGIDGGGDMTRDEYIKVEADGLSLEDRVKATMRVTYVAEIAGPLEKEITERIAAGETDAIAKAVSAVTQSLVPQPPRPGLTYAGESTDGSVVVWFDGALGKDVFFKNGVEIATPSS